MMTELAVKAIGFLAETEALAWQAGVNWVKVVAALAVMVTGLFAALSIGKSLAKAVESMARQPEVADKIRNIFLLGAALMEATALYALLVFIMS